MKYILHFQILKKCNFLPNLRFKFTLVQFFIYTVHDRIKWINLITCPYTIDVTMMKKKPGFCVTSCPGTVVKHKKIKKRKS